MNWKAIVLGATTLGAYSAPVAAQAPFSIRNDTRQTLSCGLQRPGGSANDLFILRPGATWTHGGGDGSARALRCDVNRLPLRARIRPGSYALGEDSGGMVVLRASPATATAPAPRAASRCSDIGDGRANNPPDLRRFTASPAGAAGGARVLRLRAEASDPDGDPLIYTYSSTAGRVAGDGPEVLWTLSDPGVHTVTVEIGDRRGCITFGSVTSPG